MNRYLLSLLLAAGLAGCARRAANTATSEATTQPATPAPQVAQRGDDTRPPAVDEDDSVAALTTPPVYFSLDSATLVPEARAELERIAEPEKNRRAELSFRASAQARAGEL